MDKRPDKGNAHGLERKASGGGPVVEYAQQKRRVRIARQVCIRRQIGAGRRIRIEVPVHQVWKYSDANVIAIFRPGLEVMRAARLGYLAAGSIMMRMLKPVAALAIA